MKSQTTTPSPRKRGTVDGSGAAHARVVSHGAYADSRSNDQVLSVTVDLEAETQSAIGVRMQFLTNGGKIVHEVVETIPRNSGTKRTVTMTAIFDPDAEYADSFSKYHVRLEQA